MRIDSASINVLVTQSRRFLPFLILVFAACHTGTPKTTSSPTPVTTPVEIRYFHGTGVVTKVVRENPYDKSLASVELNHGEIVGLMPAMRMEFYVKNVSLLDGLKVGDLVDFTIEEKGSTEIISEIKKK